MFSRRSHFDLSPTGVARAPTTARPRHRPILDLTESNPTRAQLPYDRDAIVAALSSAGSLLYEPAPLGLESARLAVAGHIAAQGANVDPSRIVLTAGTSEAYAFAFKLLCDPSDEVLIPQPSYPLFEHLAALESVRPVAYRLAYDGAWHIDLPSVRAALSPRTRAIVCVSPNNPTGSYVKRDELDALASLGLPIVGDEVFARYPFRSDPTRAGSVLNARGAPLVVSLGGLSKSAALPQVKLAWMALAGDDACVEEAIERLELVADAFLSVGGPVQNGTAALLAAGSITEVAIRERTRSNLIWLTRAMAGSTASILDVEGGWYAVVRVPRTRSEESWVLAFLEDDDVLVHPAHFFDFEAEAHLVISLLTPEAILREGATRILERLARET
jgi:alanine-synthesizing transaminase